MVNERHMRLAATAIAVLSMLVFWSCRGGVNIRNGYRAVGSGRIVIRVGRLVVIAGA